MPVEIKELVIKAEFGSPRQETSVSAPLEASELEEDDLVQECVRQVLEILERKRER
jgi:hypothetical protein